MLLLATPKTHTIMQTIHQTYFFEHITPEEVYQAYTNENKHSTFTASECEISRQVGGHCSMYDGYIEAENVSLVPGKHIEQKWAAKEDTWPDGHWSLVKIELEDKNKGTLLTLTHSDVPDDLKDSLEKGWVEHYWEQMDDYFG